MEIGGYIDNCFQGRKRRQDRENLSHGNDYNNQNENKENME